MGKNGARGCGFVWSVSGAGPTPFTISDEAVSTVALRVELSTDSVGWGEAPVQLSISGAGALRRPPCSSPSPAPTSSGPLEGTEEKEIG